jgi:hypothetical protein
MNRLLLRATLALLAACQGYDFVYQPDSNREGTHLRFAVQTPSKADILFVVDNSISMTEEQNSLMNSVNELLIPPKGLAGFDTSYRIGIVSTDVRGFSDSDTCDTTGVDRFTDDYGVDPNDLPVARGNCQAANVDLRYPHDGARGRLMAAFDPVEFDPDNVAFIEYVDPDPAVDGDDDGTPDNDYTQPALLLDTTLERDAFTALAPTGLTTCGDPSLVEGECGARWVIDRGVVQAEACVACGAEVCNDFDTEGTFTGCAEDVATALVIAYFRANVRGLGIDGKGWEEGMNASLLAVGIDPEVAEIAGSTDDEAQATSPGGKLTDLGAPNSYLGSNDAGQIVAQSWIRPDALLAVMYLSDEEDCSMQSQLYQSLVLYEDNAGQPAGSLCYQPAIDPQHPALPYFLRPGRAADLLTYRKSTASRVAIGLIGGVEKAGDPGNERSEGLPVDCVSYVREPDGDGGGEPSNYCSCLHDVSDLGWCFYTENQTQPLDPTNGNAPTDPTNPNADPPGCDAFRGSRYVTLASRFGRRTFDSICQPATDGQTCTVATQATDCRDNQFCNPTTLECVDRGFGAALQDFARIAVEACFDLNVRPAYDNPSNIVVRRLAAADADSGSEGLVLTRFDESEAGGTEAGWFYQDEPTARVCLTGIDRLIGDEYDIFVLTRDEIDYTR